MPKVSPRPTTIPGLATRVLGLRPRAASGCGLLLLVLFLLGLAWCASAAPTRVATFNIESFPRDARQVDGALEAVAALDAPVVAVQEITDPAVMRAAARSHLGPAWAFVVDDSDAHHHVGVLYDGARYGLSWARTHHEPRLGPRSRPALEVRLRALDGGRAVRVIVVHLKAGGDGVAARREQLRRLAPIVAAAVESWDELVVLGDFNTTGDEDRETVARFARDVGLVWASEPLACTSYWNRRDGCLGSALDHVLTRRAPADITARGPCESVGCDPGDRCPAFHREVSDHCPVTADLR